MKITKIVEGADRLSHFEEMDSQSNDQQPLGLYSKKYPANGIIFRDFAAGLIDDWHNDSQVQYIIYLEGQVVIEASNGEKRLFQAGDVIIATDISEKVMLLAPSLKAEQLLSLCLNEKFVQ